MKKFTLLILAVMLAIAGWSQTQALNESFLSTTFPPLGWNRSVQTGISDGISPNSWIHLTETSTNPAVPTALLDGSFAVFDAYLWENNATQSLITPTLYPVLGNSTLHYTVMEVLLNQIFIDAGMQLYIEFSTDGGSSWTTSTTNILAAFTGYNTATDNAVAHNLTVDLSAYNGGTVKIRFRAISDYGGFVLALDNVYGVNREDVVVSPTDLSITTNWLFSKIPLSQAFYQLSANVTNNGADYVQGTETISMNITGAETYSENVIIPDIAFGETVAVSATSLYIPTNLGNYNVSFTSSLSDDNLANNSSSRAFEVTQDLYQIDNGTNTGGVGSNTGAITLGNIFYFTNSEIISSIDLGFSSAATTELVFQFAIYSVNINTGMATNVYTSPNVTRTSAMAGTITNFNIPYYTVPAAGYYLVAVKQLGTTNVAIGYDNQAGGHLYIVASTGEISTNSSFGNTCIRVRVGAEACEPLADLILNNLSATSATISWTEPSSGAPADGYQIYVSTSPTPVPDATTPPTTTNVVFTNNSVDLSNLTPNTHYYVYVRSACDVSSELYSTWSMNTNFTTLCGAITITSSTPFFENFDSYTGTGYSAVGVMPNCWHSSTNNANNYIPHISAAGTGSYPHSPNNAISFYASNGSYAYAVLPAFTNPINLLQIDFWYGYESATDGTLTFGYITGPQNDMTTYTVLANIPGTTTVSRYPVPGTSYSLASVPAGATYIVFRWYKESTWYTASIDDVTVSLLPDCSAPTAINIPTLESNGATINWFGTASEGFETQLQLTGGTWSTLINPISVVANSADFTGLLTANTAYQFRVRSLCTPTGTSGVEGEDYSAWSAIYTFTTPCEGITMLPWTENFDSYSSGTVPSCWSRLGQGTTYPAVYTSSYSSSPNSLYYSGTTNAIAITPPFGAELNTLQVSFQLRLEGASSGTFSVGYLTDITNASTFVAVQTFNNTSWAPHDDISFAGIPNGIHNIAFKQNGSSTGWYTWLDDVVVSVLPDCSAPTAINTPTLESDGATINWFGTASEGFETQLQLTGGTWSTLINPISVVANSANFTGLLTANTSYQFRVRALCTPTGTSGTEGADYSAWSYTYTFTTPCAEYPLPFTETFATWTTGSGNWSNSCWTKYTGVNSYTPSSYPYIATTAYPSPVTGTSTPNSLYLYNSTTTISAAFLPLLAANGENLKIEFDAYMPSSERLDVVVTTNPMNMAGWTTLYTVQDGTSTNKHYVVTIPNYQTGQYIGFKSHTGSSYAYVDNILVREIYDANDILTFSFPAQTGPATINPSTHTVAIEVNFAADLANLTPSITVSPYATISPLSGITQDFTSPVTYTVTSESGTPQVWTITVTQAATASDAKDILTFTIPSQIGVSTITSIDAINGSIDVIMPWNINLATALTPTFTISSLATVTPASGVAQVFSSPVTYTVTAEDLTEKEWIVTVTNAPMPVVTVPYLQDFELPTANGDFTMFNAEGTNNWIVGSATGNPTPGNSLYVSNNGSNYFYNTGATSRIASYVVVDFDNFSEYIISFDWKAIGESSTYDYMEVFLAPVEMTLPTAFGSYTYAAWMTGAGVIQITKDGLAPVTDGTNAKFGYNNPNWTNCSMTIAGSLLAGTTKKLVFLWWNDGSGGTATGPAAIDNLHIIGTNCIAPTNLHEEDLTATSANITWAELGASESWNLKVNTTTMSDMTATADIYDNTVNSTTLPLSSLDPETTYHVYVQGICNGVTAWVHYSFTTPSSCPTPAGLLVNMTPTEFTVAWLPLGATAWNYFVSTTPITDPANEISNPGTTSSPTVTFPTIILGATYYFYVQSDCTDGAWASTSFIHDYCTPHPSSVDNNGGIGNVTFGIPSMQVNNTTPTTSGTSTHYADFTNLTGAAYQNQTSFSVSITNLYFGGYMARIWVDWNNDLNFNPVTELVAGPSADATQYTLQATIPTNTPIGNYRMRIGTNDSELNYGTITPCYTGQYGSFQDYTLQILPAYEIVSITPVTANFDVCEGTTQATALALLPATTTITDSEATDHTVALTWLIADYDADAAGDYTATGTFSLPAGVSQPSTPMTLEVTSTITVNANPAVLTYIPVSACVSYTLPTVPDGVWTNGNDDVVTTTDTTGIFTLTVTNTADCTATTTLNVTINPLPTFEVDYSANMCVGEEITVTFTGTPNFTIDGTVDIDDIGTGLTFAYAGIDTEYSELVNTIELTTAGTYTFHFTSLTDDNACVATLTDAITVTVNDIPATPTLTSIADTVCEGTPIDLSTIATGTWSFDDTELTDLVVTEAGVYSVVAEANGCSSTAATFTLTTDAPVTAPTIADMSACAGETVVLPTEFGGIWYNANQEVVSNTTVTGLFTHIIVSTNTCPDAETIIEVTFNALPTVETYEPVIMTSPYTLPVVAGGVWTNANNEVVTVANVTGTYTLTVTNASNCTATTTVNVEILVGIDANLINSISVYPNPNSGEFTINLSKVEKATKYQIVDVKGAIIIEKNIENGNVVEQVSLNVLPGTYYVKVMTNSNTYIEPIIIK